ncbi:aromatic aminobenezylarsenical efflux permease ArsG family transporter [Methanospirillum hungatei]|uniref:aromatic aminobenezylarsenical efflux permease ArsG family transporter n=1 Tax=Methanospirillum hungatei TaxID=2203 RepID=UPI002B7C1824|nr:aromatic aminobenezylarsenical efflux permease ArsG family transporter [Methanospirillum hungatei]HOW05907.1 aromatic aminobenezylarsenical efflux permease ArsG family transporter [Methanospirillum hungatei]
MSDLMSFMEAMGNSDIPLVAAFFIGLMMAISPCPLATNITAIAYISRNLSSGKYTLFVGSLYTIGRVLVYVAIAALIVLGGLKVQSISLFLQEYGDLLLGPILLICGILMLEVIPLSMKFEHEGLSELKEKLSKKFLDKGFFGSFLLGILFALSFCPFSAVLFFGMLVPLALSVQDPIGVPLVFGLATGLPVIIFAALLSTGVGRCGAMMNKVQTAEKIFRRAVAVLFIIIGAYYTVQTYLL